jgi:molybdopterin molybdotransferase
MNHLHTEGFRELTKVDDALRILFGTLREQPVRLESVAVERALGRYLGKDVVANQYLPTLDRSVIDGYAIRAEDVRSASQENPVILRVVGESRLGETPRTQVGRGECVAVGTGSVIPKGADAVVMVERTIKLPAKRIGVDAPSAPGQGIARKGEDVTPGMVVLRAGMPLRPQDIGILKVLALRRIYVARKPRIAVLSTGNELVNSKEKAREAEVIDVNRPIISGMLQDLGTRPIDLGISKDRKSNIRKTIQRGLNTCDAVIISAGSSVGRRDLVPECINSLGKPGMIVHGVAMRPAMPTGLAVVNHKPVFSLPGFPVSAYFAFRTFVRPVIAKMLGVHVPFEPTVNARLSERIVGIQGNRTHVRVVVKREGGQLVAEPLKLQRSSIMMSMVRANGIITINEGVKAIEAGQIVEVELIGGIEP